MWQFYEVCYYFDYSDIETIVSTIPCVNETIFMDKQKLIQFLKIHYNNEDDSSETLADKQLMFTEAQIPIIPGECKQLFYRNDMIDHDVYIGYIKKMNT